jgi:hypothetical protein
VGCWAARFIVQESGAQGAPSSAVVKFGCIFRDHSVEDAGRGDKQEKSIAEANRMNMED